MLDHKGNKKTFPFKPIKIPKTKQSTLFSYIIEKSPSTVVLSQQETGFVLSLKIKTLNNTVHITSFTVIRHTQLNHLNPELNDAGLLEIMVQALLILFTYAEQYEAKKILFMLTWEDATHLTDFESFFDETRTLTTKEGQKTSFTVYNTLETRNFLKAKAQIINTRLRQELWQMQKEDRYIKNFLQNHQHGTLLPFLTSKTKDSNDRTGKVIPFPKKRGHNNG